MYDYLDTKTADWMYRFLGMLYIEEKLKDTLKKDPEFKKQLKEMIGTSLDMIKKLHDTAKKDNTLKEDSMLARIGRIIERHENRNLDDVEKAKRLLEKKGYKVEKK